MNVVCMNSYGPFTLHVKDLLGASVLTLASCLINWGYDSKDLTLERDFTWNQMNICAADTFKFGAMNIIHMSQLP